ncbi:MAG: hypothetical protein JJ866_19480 [Roseibium sp.]|uniref:DUF6111 family protein n=1 Tax=Roseibium sp. TaxID=1936156 RepID=UPI001B0A2B4C|nr:DUF6111 family protein [Roseibium sp.]MBO6508003.1 hypothetical protein [Roseibium sp.]MBO6894132.1 hypothetical protein [Roseibium sp.]MBO6930710.1 hypothetical protein [Roseibium sp.]
MMRLVLTQLLLFLLPFIFYAIWLWASKKSNHPERWSKGPIAWLTLSGVGLVIAGFVAMASIDTAPEGKQFRPSEMRDGVFVPGRYE